MLCEFDYLAPRNLPELFDALAASGPDARILAGGTDLLVNVRAGLVTPKTVIDIKKIPGLQGLEYNDTTGLEIGAAVTVNQIAADPRVQKHYSLLVACAESLASYQLRNRATVVGNIVNASPCADMAPALLCYEAQVVITSKQGSRTVPIREFFTGVKKTVLVPGELVEKILVPATYAGASGSYEKLKRIKGHDLGIVGVAMLKKDGLVRMAVSSAAPTPIIVKDCKASDSAEVLAKAALEAIKPIDDVRSSKEYREFMVQVYVKRLLERV